MLENLYDVVITPDFRTYEFRSVGPKGALQKVVRYTPNDSEDLFNLGFGDFNPKSGFIDDLSVSNNGDSKRVLATVASTLYIFTDHHPKTHVIAWGSTESRTRLYRINISNNLAAIQKDFVVKGFIAGEWEPFSKGVEYEAFLVKRKY